MFEAYKGEDLVLTIATLDIDGTKKANVSSAIISVYYLNNSGVKQYNDGVASGTMTIQTGLCSYKWSTPLEPIENDWIVEFRLTDVNGNAAVYTDIIKILELSSGGGGTGGLTIQEHTWLAGAYAQTLNLTYDVNNNLHANIQKVKADSVTGLSDFQTNLTGLALEATLQSVYILASSTNAAISGSIAQETTLLNVASSINALSSIVALQSTLNQVLILASSTNVAVGSNVAQQTTLLATQSVVNSTHALASATNSNVGVLISAGSVYNAQIQFMYDFTKGAIKIDFNTGIVAHYKEDNTTLLVRYQLIDETFHATNDPGSAFGRLRL